jgi:hypothetical protein
MQVSVGFAAGARKHTSNLEHTLLVCPQPSLLMHMSSNMFAHAFGYCCWPPYRTRHSDATRSLVPTISPDALQPVFGLRIIEIVPFDVAILLQELVRVRSVAEP